MSRVAILLFVLFANSVAWGEDAIRIGVSSALTGGAASYGNDIKNALVFANRKLANNQYKFIFEDDKCTGKDAVSVAQKLVQVDKVKYVLGFACSGTILSAAPIYEKARVLAISAGAAAPDVSKAGDYIFRTWPSDVMTAKILYDYVHGRHRRFGIFSEETDFPQGLAQAFINQNADGTLEIISENYLSSDTDFRTVLLKFRSKGIQGLFLNTQSEDKYLQILKQSHDLKFDIPLYGAYNPGSITFLKLAGDLANGIVFVDAPEMKDILTEDGKKLFDEFVEEFGEPNSWHFIIASSIEAFRALHLAIRSGEKPKDYLYQTKFSGMFGDYSFNHDGDIQGISLSLRTIESGTVVPLNRDS